MSLKPKFELGQGIYIAETPTKCKIISISLRISDEGEEFVGYQTDACSFYQGGNVQLFATKEEARAFFNKCLDELE